MGACSSKNKKLSKEDQQIRDAFDKVDTNKSGFIEKHELTTMINQLADDMGTSKPNQEEIDEAMKAIDINQDGKINFNEYKKFITAALKAHTK